MCAISGAFSGLHKTVDINTVNHILTRASERGKDSAGLYRDGEFDKSSKADTAVFLNWYKDAPRIVLSNNRAEPTTEYVENKSTDDVQPYREGEIVVVHNGTIANDKDICKKFGFAQPNIDSKVLPMLLNKLWNGTLDNLVEILNKEVIGSYALGIYHEKYNKLFLVSNYKPIYTEIINGVVYFSSLDKFLPGFQNRIQSTVQKLEPYTAIEFAPGTGYLPRQIKLNPNPLNKKALVVCSGGLDSTVVAAEMKKQGYDITLLHIQYKARAEENEVKAVKDIAKFLDVPLLMVETDIFKNVIKASRLTGTHDETIADGEAGAELAWEWVPARNLIMLSIATGIAEARGIETIALGNNLEEAGAYADNEQEFIYQFNKLIPNAINLDKRLQVIEPVGNLMKHDIVKLGLENKAPLHLTWSCYNSGELHCGVCGPCYMRKKAFEMNKAKEVISYNVPTN